MFVVHSVQASVLPSPVAEAANKDIQADELKEGVSGEVSVLLECTGTNVELDQQRVDAFAEAVLESGVVVDAAISQNSDQEKVFMCMLLLVSSLLPFSIYYLSISVGLVENSRKSDNILGAAGAQLPPSAGSSAQRRCCGWATI